MGSGGAAGATALLVVYPIDLARTRYYYERPGILDVTLKTAKQGGWRQGGAYSGFAITCMGVVLYRGAYFGLYDTFSDVDLMKRAGFFGKFALGYAVTVIAGLVSYPFDTIRRRLMMTSGQNNAFTNSSWKFFTKIMKEEGLGTLYRGAGSNVLRALSGALLLVSFDYCKGFYLEWKYPELKDP